MRDLEARIEEWRRTLAAVGGRAELIDELEGHLREEIQRLLQAGQPPEQAWAAAVARLGTPQALAAEFAKVGSADSWRPARWAMIAYLVLGACLVAFLAIRLKDGRTTPLLAVHVGAVTLGYGAAFCAGLISVCYLLVRPFGAPGAGRSQLPRRDLTRLAAAAAVLTAVGIVLGCIWAREHMGRYWGWDLKESGALAVLTWYGLTLLVLVRFPAYELPGVLMGVVGNVVVSLAWFGSGAAAGRAGFTLFLTLFALSQLVILCLGFVPAGRLRGKKA